MTIMPIGGITPTALLTKVTATATAASAQGPDFGAAIKDVIQAVDRATGEANTKVGAMITGEGDVHEAMIALQHADMVFQLSVQVRNKLVQAYQDVMRMSV